MAEAMFMYYVTAGIFAFFVAVVFGARGARKRGGGGGEVSQPETHSSSTSSTGEKRRVKKFKSDGTPVYE